MEIFKELTAKGYKHYYQGTIEELDYMDKDNQNLHSEIMQVIMWLYEKHDIWVSVNVVIIGSDEWEYEYVIHYLPIEFKDVKRRSIHLETINSFNEGMSSYSGAWHTPTEAYEAAIKYCLEKLC